MQIGHNVYQHKYVHQHYYLVLLESSRYLEIFMTLEFPTAPDHKYYSHLM